MITKLIRSWRSNLALWFDYAQHLRTILSEPEGQGEVKKRRSVSTLSKPRPLGRDASNGLIFFLVFLIGCQPYSSKNTDYSWIKVIDVVDGDTIKLADGSLLRYIGLDTPEIRIKKGEKFIYSPQPFAEEAKGFNQKLVENKFIRIEFDVEKKDQYNRLLGYCFLDDIFVNAKLIEEGFAVTYTKPPNAKYVDLFIKLQKEARENKKGLWGAYEVIEHNQAIYHLNKIRTVRGKVLNAYKSPKCIFLNFGSNYKKDFTIVIFSNSFKNFYDAGIDPCIFYPGKLVEISGKIREYNGPEIIANSPQEIAIVETNGR